MPTYDKQPVPRKDGQRSNLRPSRVREMTPVEAAWVGAMIEGEGTVAIAGYNGHRYPRICVINTDPEVISALLRATGAGSVFQKPAQAGSWSRKLCFVWWISRYLEAKALLVQCTDYSTKLQKLEAV